MLKVFVSSTCFDLKEVRNNISKGIREMGYQPILSDKDHVLFDPNIHTHQSCINAVLDCDLVILIISHRFGGVVVPEVLDLLDLQKATFSDSAFFTNVKAGQVSITQIEILTAIENEIPIYTFIDSNLYSQHEVYQRNRKSGKTDKIDFPGFKNKEEATYVFEFFNFMRKRKSNNQFKEYSLADEIIVYLKSQLSMWFKNLVKDQKYQRLKAKETANSVLANVVEHLSKDRRKAFSNLFTKVDGSDTIRILGTGVTNFLSKRDSIHAYLKNKNSIEILLINNQIVKADWHCTSDEFIERVNESNGSTKLLPPVDELKVLCPLADLNFLIDKNHFNNYYSRKDYIDEVNRSIGLIKAYQKDVEDNDWEGKITARHFESFVPMSISAIFPEDTNNRDLLAEFIIPFTDNRIMFHSSSEKNPEIYSLFMEFFDLTWKKAREI